MHGLLLALDIKGLSTKQIKVQFFNKSFKRQLNLIFCFFRISP